MKPPTRITRIAVVPCYDWRWHDLPIRKAIYDFFLIANDAALLFSWYLHRAGGVPANHSELTVVARDDPEEVENEPHLSSLVFEFESMDALADWSILYLPDDRREKAALTWLHTVIKNNLTERGVPTDRLDDALLAALASDPKLITPSSRAEIERLGDDPIMSEDQFWGLIGLLEGSVDEPGMERLKDALMACSNDQIEGFDNLLRRALAVLDTEEHANPPIDNIHEPPVDSELPFSDDTFLYVRCDVVASGRDAWLHVANNPAAMAQPWDIRSERLLTVVPSLRA